MATWLARDAVKSDPEHRPVTIIGQGDKPRWSAVWTGNPHIMPIEARTGAEPVIRDGPGCRHYVDTRDRKVWRFRNVPEREPGDLFLPPAVGVPELPAGFIYIEPNIKEGASLNKLWPFGRYQALVSRLNRPAVQCVGHAAQPRLQGAQVIETPSFWHAAAVLARAALYVGSEGAMHHAAAALGVPAVVIFGGYISPAVTGYKDHTNLYAGGKPCGRRAPCEHCKAAMKAITVDGVLAAIFKTETRIEP